MSDEVVILSSLTRRERWKKILELAWPLIVANSFWNLQITIDRIFLGRFSVDALAAAMAVMGVFWTPMALLQQTAAYVTTFVAQYFGAKQLSMMGSALWQAIYISIFGGFLVIALIPFGETFFAFVGHDANVQALEVSYFSGLTLSAMPVAIVAAISGYFTGLGETKVIIAINCIGLIVNAVLDYCMIFGNFGFPIMGVYGAALATTIASWASAVYGLYLIMKRKNSAEEGLFDRRPRLDLLRRYLKFGLPSGMQWALEGLAFTVFMIIVGRMQNGSVALAASSIAVTIMMLAALPALGIAQAVSVLVGQFIGEKRPAEAETSTYSGAQVALMYIAIAAISFIVLPDLYISWFKNDENASQWAMVAELAKVILRFVAAFTIFDAMNFIFSFALKGAGDTRFVTSIALTLPWPLMVLPTWLMAEESSAIYWAWGFASAFIIAQGVIFYLRFRGEKWKSMSVIH